MSEGIKLESPTDGPSGLPPVPLFGTWVNGEPLGEMWTGTEILARLDCAGQPWAHLRLDESGWCQVVEDGDIGAQCFEGIAGYVVLPNVKGHPRSPAARLVPERSDKHDA